MSEQNPPPASSSGAGARPPAEPTVRKSRDLLPGAASAPRAGIRPARDPVPPSSPGAATRRTSFPAPGVPQTVRSRAPGTPGPAVPAGGSVPAGAAGPAAPGADAPETCTGETFGRYQLLQELGRGGMGIVFKAWDTELKRLVALKTLRSGPTPGASTPSPSGRSADQEDIDRFLREARAAGRLRHPNIVQVHDVGTCAGRHFFTMDFIEGESLETALPRLETRRLLEILRDCARALHAAHEAGVVHRDVKPANILLDGAGRPYVGDFGLAKEVRETGGEKLTMSGAIMGTPNYMSPEQAAGDLERIGPASDQWSLGVILYQVLAGVYPFDGASFVEILTRIVHQEPVSPARVAAGVAGRPRVARDLETICLKSLEKHPARRYASAAALADELDRYLAGEPILARPVSWSGRLWRRALRHKPVALSLVGIALLVPVLAITAWVLRARSGELAAKEGELAQKARTEDLRRRAEPQYLEGTRRLEETLTIWRAHEGRWQKARALDANLERALTNPAYQERLKERADLLAQARSAFDAAVREDPGYALALAARAQVEDLAGNAAAAVADADRALQIDPACFAARYQRALARLRLHEGTRGAPFVLEFLTPAPGAAGRSTRVFRIRKAGNETPAEGALREQAAADLQALKQQAGVPPVLVATVAAAVLYCEGKLTEAGEAIEPHLGETPADYQRRFWSCRILTANCDYERAVAFCEHVVMLRPEDASSRCAYGQALVLAGRLEEGGNQFARAIASDPGFLRGYLAHAGACRALGRFEPAAQEAEKACGLRPDDPAARLERAQVRMAQGKWAEAEADLGEVIRLAPGHAETLAARADCRLELGRKAEALADAEAATAAEPASPAGPRARARCRMHVPGRDFKAAVDDLAAALALNPDPVDRAVLDRLLAEAKEQRARLGDAPADR